MTQEEIAADYGTNNDLLKDFLDELANQMKLQVKDLQIRLAFPFNCRIKRLDALLNKVAKGTFTPKKSVLEMQDLIGIRFVTLYKRDIPRLEESIQALFPGCKRYNTQTKGENNTFGYASTHFIISPPESWKSIGHLKKFYSLQAEIQVRTLSQHIWAECSHSLHYKSTVNIPPNLERPLFRLSALMEIVDNELSNILHDHEQYTKMVANLNLENLLKEDSNGVTVGKLLSTVFSEQKPVSENDYALIHRALEGSNEIYTLETLLSVINKYKPDSAQLKDLNHAQVIELILAAFKTNNYSLG